MHLIIKILTCSALAFGGGFLAAVGGMLGHRFQVMVIGLCISYTGGAGLFVRILATVVYAVCLPIARRHPL